LAYSKLDAVLKCSGGYNLGENGGTFMSKIEGCYNNIIGIPLYGLCKLLLEKMKEAEWIK